jgi:hypothetical protein
LPGAFQSSLVRDVTPLRTVGLSPAAPADGHPPVRLGGVVLVEPRTELHRLRGGHGVHRPGSVDNWLFGHHEVALVCRRDG